MKEINLGRVLITNRHKRGITQDEVAEYMGVSKASVSKWETGTTYPDITLLPRLASYFNISIDELMGYEPQMTKEDIRKLYRELCREFYEKPFDMVMEQCREIVRKYFSCGPLLFQMGTLYVNHSMLAGSPEQTRQVLEEAERLFVRVQEEGDDAELSSQAVSMQALCLLQLGRADEVLELLAPVELMRLTPEPLLASAYQTLGNNGEARQILQIGIYVAVIELLNLLPAYLELCVNDVSAFEETDRRMEAVIEAFSVRKLHPSVLASLYLSAARGFCLQGNADKALDNLEYYTELVTSDFFPLHLHGDGYFNLLDDWLEENLVLGSDPPRDEGTVRRSVVEAVTGQPLFASYSEHPRFQTIVSRLQMMLVQDADMHRLEEIGE